MEPRGRERHRWAKPRGRSKWERTRQGGRFSREPRAPFPVVDDDEPFSLPRMGKLEVPNWHLKFHFETSKRFYRPSGPGNQSSSMDLN
jgi:hypothetical protein